MPRHKKEALKSILAKPFNLLISITGKCKETISENIQNLFKSKPSRSITKIKKQGDNICFS